MNVSTLLSNAALAHGERTAIRCGARGASYSQFDALVAAAAGALRSRYEQGDRVLLYLRNGFDFPVLLFALFRAGLVAVPTNVKLHPREIAYMAGHCAARAIIADADNVSILQDALEEPVEIFSIGEAAGAMPAQDLFLGEGMVGEAEVEPTDIAWIFYTSGTTGRPKGAMLSHRNLIAMTVNCLADMYGFQPDDIVLHAAPLSHGSGLYLLAPVARGACNLINDAPSFEPNAVMELLRRERVTAIAFLAPTMIVRLLDAAPDRRAPDLRRILYGGAPIHVDHLRAAVRRFGPILVQLYGQGEAPMTISYLPASDHQSDDPSVLSSAGVARSGVEIKIAGEDGASLARGEVGEIAARGDVVMAGYWNDPAATAKTLRRGWLHTGDVGMIDAAGRLHLLDRMNDVIISGGANIYPREVEDVLVQHPAIREAVVFGVPDREWGESVAAAVTLAAGARIDDRQVIAFCQERLASFKKPKFLHVVDELPKSAYGKVMRRELRRTFFRSEAAGQ